MFYQERTNKGITQFRIHPQGKWYDKELVSPQVKYIDRMVSVPVHLIDSLRDHTRNMCNIATGCGGALSSESLRANTCAARTLTETKWKEI
tara:strand:- start:750 stop:1022 length:273 start_codon:yes stop_codon:yes gene_type:complete